VTEDVDHPAVIGSSFRHDSLDTPAVADVQTVVGERGSEANALPGVANENGEFGFAVIDVSD
jgi:hypothetical protein